MSIGDVPDMIESVVQVYAFIAVRHDRKCISSRDPIREQPCVFLSLYSDPELARRRSARYRREDQVRALRFVSAGSVQAKLAQRGRAHANEDARNGYAGAHRQSPTNLTRIRHIVLACGIYSKSSISSSLRPRCRRHRRPTIRGCHSSSP